jgi:hypothetical protein
MIYEWEIDQQFETAKRLYREHDREINSLKVQIKDLQILLMEIRGFVEYVDKTAPELRTAYHVSKRME